MYQVGELDQRIVIKRDSIIDDGYGGEEKAGERTIVSGWAKAKPLSGGESKDQERIHDTTMYQFIIRYTNELLEEDYVYWNDQKFEIRSILDKGPRSLYLEFKAERNAN